MSAREVHAAVTEMAGADMHAKRVLPLASAVDGAMAVASLPSRRLGSDRDKDLDAPRGSLHLFGAVRGTIIATSNDSKGTREAAFEPGAAPITLIDGEKLIDLLITHGIGVPKNSLEVLDLDLDLDLNAEALAEVEESPGGDTGVGE